MIRHNLSRVFGSIALLATIACLVSIPLTAQAALVGHWTFDNTALDSAGSQNGTLTGGASYTTSGRVGSHALLLDGNDDYVELGTVGIGNPLMLNGSSFTLSAWTFQNNGDISQRVIDKSDGGNGANGYGLFVNPTGGLGKGVLTNVANVTSGSGDALGVWEHVMATNDGTNVFIYVNGIQAHGSALASPGLAPNVATNMRIGTWNHTTAREWNGMLDDVGVFNNVVTATQALGFYTLSADADPLGNGADLDYNLSQAQSLIDLHNAQSGSVTIDDNTWTYATDLTTNPGELTKLDGFYYLTLDGLGTGVSTFVAPIPEPATCGLLLMALPFLRGMRRTRQQTKE